ncbi:hypothetical protein HDU85_005773, partial [Gaertneriomyces sp. JEL0708]
RLTARQVYLMISLSWCLSATLGSLPYWFGIDYVIQPSMVYCNCDWSGPEIGNQAIAWACFVVCSTANFGSGIIYALIFGELIKNRRHFKILDRPEMRTTIDERLANKKARKANELEYKVAIKFSVIVGTLVVNWLPYDVKFAYEAVTHREVPQYYDCICIAMAWFK